MIKEGVQSLGAPRKHAQGGQSLGGLSRGGRMISPLLVCREETSFPVFTKGEVANPPSKMPKKLVSLCACLSHDLGRLMNADRGTGVIELSRPPIIDGQLLLEN